MKLAAIPKLSVFATFKTKSEELTGEASEHMLAQ